MQSGKHPAGSTTTPFSLDKNAHTQDFNKILQGNLPSFDAKAKIARIDFSCGHSMPEHTNEWLNEVLNQTQGKWDNSGDAKRKPCT